MRPPDAVECSTRWPSLSTTNTPPYTGAPPCARAPLSIAMRAPRYGTRAIPEAAPAVPGWREERGERGHRLQPVRDRGDGRSLPVLRLAAARTTGGVGGGVRRRQPLPRRRDGAA